MNSKDIQSFFADEVAIDREEYVVFTYWFETFIDPRRAAANLCRESSTAQWQRPGVNEDLRPRHAARVLDIEVQDKYSGSVFDGNTAGQKFQSARVRIAHPHINFGTKIPNLLTAAMGEGVFHCDGISSVKLLDIEFPESYLSHFQGPRFGTKGLRSVLDVSERPLFFGVVKPNVGLDPKNFAEIALEAWMGGLDAAKDDEMLADVAYSRFEERMRFVGRARERAEELTGERKMFIANITDDVENLKRLHDIAAENGVNAVMLNVMAVGLSAVRWLKKNSVLPIVAHFDCIAPMSRHPGFGVSTTVITKLERLCGCDAIIMPGFGVRMGVSEDEVIANVGECTKPMGKIKNSLPVPGGSDWAGTLPLIYEKLRTLDFAMVPGRGVFNHPSGPRAGAMSLRQAWNAIVDCVDLKSYAENYPELAEAIQAFGVKEEGQDAQLISSEMRPLVTLGYTGAELLFVKN